MVRSHTHAQHFLKSPRLVAELIGHSNIRKNDLVYDLGAGSGVIASVLACRARSVVAVEIEPEALKKLHDNMKRFDNVLIVERDILTVEAPSEPYKIFANIPFNLSAKVVRKFAFAKKPPKSIYLIVQKQFARKLVPGDTHFTGQLSAELGPRWFTRIRKPLRRFDFTPPPAVDTVLLELKRREEALVSGEQYDDYRAFIKRSFTEQKYFTNLPRQKVNLSPELRPSQLTLEQWLKLWSVIKS
ncbi:MAG TPA: rRNA adenine N-6-methyltransferase family protein [Candidatus Saccharimonadales bacterium]|nr:rRNA adenine N-6-methyltransferase family protein [Candidatus Saccharimonadales bacterium]